MSIHLRKSTFRFMAIGLALFLAPLAPAPTFGAGADGQFAIKGGGLQSCANFIEAARNKSPDLAAYGGWIEGYLTGQNQRLEATYDVAPWQQTVTIIGAMVSVCENLPDDTRFIDAFDRLLRAFLPSRLPKASTVVQLKVDKKSTVLYADVLDLIASRLRQLGYDTPVTPREFPLATQEALRAFQADNALPATGHPDQRTLFQLFVTSINAKQ